MWSLFQDNMSKVSSKVLYNNIELQDYVWPQKGESMFQSFKKSQLVTRIFFLAWGTKSECRLLSGEMNCFVKWRISDTPDANSEIQLKRNIFLLLQWIFLEAKAEATLHYLAKLKVKYHKKSYLLWGLASADKLLDCLNRDKNSENSNIE